MGSPGRLIAGVIVAVVVASTDQLAASATVTWRNYVAAAGEKDENDILACYSTRLKEQIEERGVRFGVHVEEIHGLLHRDFRVRVVGTRRDGERKIITVRFQEKKNRKNHFEAEVILVKEDGRWLIDRPPAALPEPSYWERRLKSIGGVPALIGIGAGAIVLLFVLRKVLRTEE